MTRTAGATSALLGRLLLLGLLLIGLGVVHTLAHADAHDGVTAHTTTHHRAPAPTDQEPSSALHAHETAPPAKAPPRATITVTTVTTADTDSLPEADCWASVPTGPGPIPPPQPAAETTTTATYAAPPAEGLSSPRAHTSPQALGILRI